MGQHVIQHYFKDRNKQIKTWLSTKRKEKTPLAVTDRQLMHEAEPGQRSPGLEQNGEGQSGGDRQT